MAKAKAGKKAKKPAKKHVVRGEARMALAPVGHALNLRVYRRNSVLGRLQIGQGGLNWVPSGKRTSQGKRIPWEVFETIMKEWPFGHSKRARLKFVDGAMRWRRPGKSGAGREVTWDELVIRMRLPLPKSALKKLAEVKKARKAARKAAKKKVAKKKQAKKKAAKRKVARKKAVKKKAVRKKGARKKVARKAAVRKQAVKKKTSRKKKEGEKRPPKPAPIAVPGVREVMEVVRIVSYQAKNGDELWLNNPGSGKRRPTPITVHMAGLDLGTIDLEDLYWPMAEDRRRTARVVRYIKALLEDPEHWIRNFGQRTGYCGVCGKYMFREESVERGIGPKCARKLGYLVRRGRRKKPRRAAGKARATRKKQHPVRQAARGASRKRRRPRALPPPKAAPGRGMTARI